MYNLAGYKEDIMPCIVSRMHYFMQQLRALCALRIDLTKKWAGDKINMKKE
jgi:hypothetical protein